MRKVSYKKVVALFIVTLFLGLNMYGQVFAQEETKNTDVVKQVVEEYFNNNTKTLQESKNVKYDDIINNLEFKKFVNLKN